MTLILIANASLCFTKIKAQNLRTMQLILQYFLKHTHQNTLPYMKRQSEDRHPHSNNEKTPLSPLYYIGFSRGWVA